MQEIQKITIIPRRRHSSLTEREAFFIYVHLYFDKPVGVLFSMIIDNKCTIAAANKRAMQLLSSHDAIEYMEDIQRSMMPEYEESDGLSYEEQMKLVKARVDQKLQNPSKEDDTLIQTLYLRELKNRDDSENGEPARIYLPEKCGACGYRQFCETNGELVCPSCKLAKYAIKTGFIDRIDYKTIIDTTKEGVTD